MRFYKQTGTVLLSYAKIILCAKLNSLGNLGIPMMGQRILSTTYAVGYLIPLIV